MRNVLSIVWVWVCIVLCYILVFGGVCIGCVVFVLLLVEYDYERYFMKFYSYFCSFVLYCVWIVLNFK